MFYYVNLIAHFRGESFNAVLKLNEGQILSKEEITELICRELKTTIPSSEISSNTTPSDEDTWDTSGDHKCDLTKKKAQPESINVEGEEYD